MLEQFAILTRSRSLNTEIANELIDLLGDANLMDVFCEYSWCHIKRKTQKHQRQN